MKVDYPKAIALLTETSAHADLITEAVSPLLEQLTKNADFLDVGVADGRLTQMIQQKAHTANRPFKSVTVIEKDPTMEPLLRAKHFDSIIIDELSDK